MLGVTALASVLIVLLLAPMVLGTHVVVVRAGRRLTTLWLLVLIGLMLLSLLLAAVSLAVSELTR